MSSNSPKVTLADIAKATGLSMSAVGYALRSHPKIKAATRERVVKVAKEMGYTPNLAAAALATQRHQGSKVDHLPIAYITRKPANPDQGLELYHSAKFFGELGYRLEEVELEGDPRGDAAKMRELRERGFVGLVLGRAGAEVLRQDLPWETFAVVALTGAYHAWPVHRVQLDVAGYVRTAWQEAWQRGYRRIGLILAQHPHELPDDDLRLGAAWASARRWPAGEIPPFLGDFGDMEGMFRWYREHRPDVVIAFPSVFRYKLWREGVELPRDCAFVGLELEGGLTEQPAKEVTCFRSATRLLTNAAGRLLDSEIRHGRHGRPAVPETLLVKAPWYEGKTLPPREQAPAG